MPRTARARISLLLLALWLSLDAWGYPAVVVSNIGAQWAITMLAHPEACDQPLRIPSTKLRATAMASFADSGEQSHRRLSYDRYLM